MLTRLITFCLENRLVVFILAIMVVSWGVLVAPFDWKFLAEERNQVAVDAIPDIGENQQIVFTEWMGRSPQDVEDQITYPLTAALLGIPEVKTIRSYSYFGFSSVYVIFNEHADWDWSRSKILEKLNSLPAGTLPPETAPALGPDATALGQVFWYTLEGHDPATGEVVGGWDLQELRSIQDFQVKYALQGVEGVAEVASVGGFQKEYQIDVDPDAMKALGVSLAQIFQAVRNSNQEVGARTIEINRAEYVIRAKGFLNSIEDLRKTVIVAKENIPVRLDQVAKIGMGPALRRGVIDKNGVEAVGGVVVSRYGANPMATIQNIKKQIDSIKNGLPEKTLEDGTTSRVTIVPFYDRSGLINETLETLNSALIEEVLITVIVVILLVLNLRSSILISLMLPLAVLICFVGMKLFKIEANVVALSGIAIAIGTIVDMGIVLCENALRNLEAAPREASRFKVIRDSCIEVGGAVLTAVLTTVISFLPVFTMIGSEGKLFKPLAYTKTFALIASVIIALTLLPPLLLTFFGKPSKQKKRLPGKIRTILLISLAAVVAIFLGIRWAPLGPTQPVMNAVFACTIIGLLIGLILVFMRFYPVMLGFFLRVKWLLLVIFISLVSTGAYIFYTLESEFMPSLDEGSFLLMPTTMPHASIGEATEIIQIQDRAIRGIPEVESVVGKIGRVDSPLDPAPVSMVETVINYKPEWGRDKEGNRIRNWRDHIKSPDDIWDEILAVSEIPGVTSAPKLQPIETRIVMLQTGMRAPIGLKIYGPDLETIDGVGAEIEGFLKQIPSVNAATVFADRVVGKPYLEINIDRDALARYGISIRSVHDIIEMGIGGKRITTTVEGRERYAVRARYLRERRDSIEEIAEIPVTTQDGAQIPLGQLAEIEFTRGPQAIKSEVTQLVSYVIFDKNEGNSEVEVVKDAQRFLAEKEASGEFKRPDGVHWKFTGNYENQLRANATLMRIVPLALGLIFILIYLQFRSVTTTFLIFSGVFVAAAGGMILIGLYQQPWFLDFTIAGTNLRDLFQIEPINWSVAVAVGFLALFGIATDDGVLMGTYLDQRFADKDTTTVDKIRQRTVEAATLRNRPAMMTTATTLLALLPVLTSNGKGSDIMVPMAIPTFGGMIFAVLTVFVVPTFYCGIQEMKLSRQEKLTKPKTTTK